MISKKLALRIIAKLPITKEQKEEIKKGVLQELDMIKDMDSKGLQKYLQEREKI